jgi:ubiquitin C-terminal hydrolase
MVRIPVIGKTYYFQLRSILLKFKVLSYNETTTQITYTSDDGEIKKGTFKQYYDDEDEATAYFLRDKLHDISKKIKSRETQLREIKEEESNLKKELKYEEIKYLYPEVFL